MKLSKESSPQANMVTNNQSELMVKVFESIADWKAYKKQHLIQQTIGFVPTMGNLHLGHLSLCETSQTQNDVTVVSIFINPTQFNDQADFIAYPQTLNQDITLLKDQGVNFCICPSKEELYADDYVYQMTENALSLELEGRFRPGHFTGMLTVVLKLLLGIGPQRAYFGEKDYQQYLLVNEMAQSFLMDCEIVACPVIREASGLPFSSRNSRLSCEERALAEQVAQVFNQPFIALEKIENQMKQLGVKIDYLEEKWGRRLMAVRVGQIRLLDNYPIG